VGLDPKDAAQAFGESIGLNKCFGALNLNLLLQVLYVRGVDMVRVFGCFYL
jgi:hypothetical protein